MSTGLNGHPDRARNTGRRSTSGSGATVAPQATTVRICLNGTTPGIEAALRVLNAGIFDEGYEISGPSRPYPNRREPGHRVYVTLWFPAPSAVRGRRTAAKQSTAPAAAPSKEGGHLS
jgi:hypothetical protein